MRYASWVDETGQPRDVEAETLAGISAALADEGYEGPPLLVEDEHEFPCGWASADNWHA